MKSLFAKRLDNAALVPEFADSPTHPRRVQPEKALLAEVLSLAIQDLRDRRVSLQIVQETKAWIRSNEADDPRCFVSLCDALGIDPHWVRTILQREGWL